MGRQEKEGKKREGKLKKIKRSLNPINYKVIIEYLNLREFFFIWNDLKLIKFWKKLIPIFFIHFLNSYINIIFIYLRTYGLNKFKKKIDAGIISKYFKSKNIKKLKSGWKIFKEVEYK